MTSLLCYKDLVFTNEHLKRSIKLMKRIVQVIMMMMAWSKFNKKMISDNLITVPKYIWRFVCSNGDKTRMNLTNLFPFYQEIWQLNPRRMQINISINQLIPKIYLGLRIGRNLKLGLGWANVEFVFYPGLGLGLTLGCFLGCLISSFFFS